LRGQNVKTNKEQREKGLENLIFGDYIDAVADLMGTTSTNAGIIMSLILCMALVFVMLVATKGKWAVYTAPISLLLSVVFFTALQWFPVWTGTVLALGIGILTAYIFSKLGGPAG